MDKLACLEQLYISNNGIEVLENLDQNGSLTTVDLASNRISKLDNLQTLENIEEFWFNDNQVHLVLFKKNRNFKFYSVHLNSQLSLSLFV